MNNTDKKLPSLGEGLGVGIASDHAGFALKQFVKKYLDEKLGFNAQNVYNQVKEML